MKKHVVAPVAAGILLAVAGNAQADARSATFNVSATVAKACAIRAADLNMGTWDGTGNLNGASTISVKCSTGTPYTVALNEGLNSSGLVADRKLANAGDTLAYNLYTDSARTQVWGETIGTDTVPGTGNGMANANERDITVYSRIALADLQAAKPGTYNDTVTATVEY